MQDFLLFDDSVTFHFHTIGPADLLHPSSAPHFKNFNNHRLRVLKIGLNKADEWSPIITMHFELK
jgi:hypothetical protein